jgi:two-component system, OmpR family, sensor kinase
MSRLFWKVFALVWVSIAGLICALILLTNVFRIQPPQYEIDLRKKEFVAELAAALVRDHNLSATDTLARAALLSESAVRLTVDKLSPSACRGGDYDAYVEADGICYAIRTTLPDPGPGKFAFLFFPFLLDAVGSLIAAAALAYYLAGPIVTLRDGLNALAHGDFRIRIGDRFGGRQDEISNLGLDFDATASKLQALQDVQQRLYHDVSHELRSPLSRIQFAIGVLRQNPVKLEAMLTRIDREIGRLDLLVDEILTLAKLDSGHISSFEENKIDIIDILAAIVDDAAFEAKAKEVSVVLDGVQSFVCDINGELIYRALENVVRNAVKYTSPGTSVTVTAALIESQSRKSLRIGVCDQGYGVPEEELGRIFEPFQRGADAAHVSGHGLGLTIARRAIEIQGGKIVAEVNDDGGLTVVIDIPGSPAV